MNADKVAMRIQQQVSGIRVESLIRGYAELEELRVVFDRTDPYPWLVDKVVGLMERHSFCNTNAFYNGDEFKMIFARATSLGIGLLNNMAQKSRAEIRQEAKRRVETLIKHGTANLTQKERDQVSRFTGGRVVFKKENER